MHEWRTGCGFRRQRNDFTGACAAAASEKASAARDLSDALVRIRCAAAASDRDFNASKRLESAAHTGRCAGKRCHFGRADTISDFGDQQRRKTSSGYRGNQPATSCLARLRDTSRGIFCNRIYLHGTSVSRNTACSLTASAFCAPRASA